MKWINKIIEIGKKIYYFIYNYMLDYRYKVPGSSGLCFAYYMILSIVPVCSLIAFLTSVFNFDTQIMLNILTNYLTEEYAEVVVSALQPKSISLTTLITLGISLFVASRGFDQLHKLSRNMFPVEKEYPFLIDQAIMLLKTVLIFILILSVISLLIVFPFFKMLFIDNTGFISQVMFLFIMIFIVLFLLYKIIPDQSVAFMDTVKGTAIATILIEIIVGILSVYFSLVDYSNVYGPLAAIVMIMFSITICAEAIYFGMYVIFECHMKRLIIQLKNEES